MQQATVFTVGVLYSTAWPKPSQHRRTQARYPARSHIAQAAVSDLVPRAGQPMQQH